MSVEAIKKALEILNQPKSMSMYASQGDMISDLLKDRRLAASTLESLQREIEQSKELDLTFEAEANQMREVSIANRHRAQEAEAEVKRLRAVVERAQLIVSTSIYPSWHETSRTALASTGGEHHAE